MPAELLTDMASLGIAGLLFVMWWSERKERLKALTLCCDAEHYATQFVEANRSLLDVVRANTEALAALREELRSHRATEAQWVERLMNQMDSLG